MENVYGDGENEIIYLQNCRIYKFAKYNVALLSLYTLAGSLWGWLAGGVYSDYCDFHAPPWLSACFSCHVSMSSPHRRRHRRRRCCNNNQTTIEMTAPKASGAIQGSIYSRCLVGWRLLIESDQIINRYCHRMHIVIEEDIATKMGTGTSICALALHVAYIHRYTSLYAQKGKAKATVAEMKRTNVAIVACDLVRCDPIRSDLICDQMNRPVSLITTP